jgi:hypothetical protein
MVLTLGISPGKPVGELGRCPLESDLFSQDEAVGSVSVSCSIVFAACVELFVCEFANGLQHVKLIFDTLSWKPVDETQEC